MKVFIILMFIVNWGFAQYNLQNWLIRLRQEKHFGLRPTESSQPILVNDVLYFGSETGYFYALRKNDGKILWKNKYSSGVAGNPKYWSEKIYFGANDGYFYCLNSKNGELVWKYFVKYPNVSEPSVHNGIVYFTGGDNALYALDAITGKWLWQYKRSFPSTLAIRGQSAPTYFQNHIFLGFSDGFFVKVHALDGKLAWEKKLNDYHRFIDIDSSAYVDEKNVIVSCYDGSLYNLNSKDGNAIWEQKIGGGYSNVLVQGTIVYVPTGTGEIVAIDIPSGKRLWSVQGERGLSTKPFISNNMLYYGTTESNLYAVDIKKRKIVWSFPTATGFSTHPIVDEKNNLYFLSNFGNFYSIKIRNINL